MDDESAKEIIAAGFNRATKGRVGNISETAPEHMMTGEQIQSLNLTKEVLIESFLQDPRVISAECSEGKFEILIEDGGIIRFNMIFGDEHMSDTPDLNENEIKDQDEEMADALFELYKGGGYTVKNMLESCRENPEVISAEYRDGEFHLNTTGGPFTFRLPGIKE